MQTVLAAMQNAGYITGRQASLAMSQPVTAVRDVAGGSGRYVADWVMDKLPQYVGGSIDQDIIVDTTIDLRHAGGGGRGDLRRRSPRAAPNTMSARRRWSPSRRTAR